MNHFAGILRFTAGILNHESSPYVSKYIFKLESIKQKEKKGKKFILLHFYFCGLLDIVGVYKDKIN